MSDVGLDLKEAFQDVGTAYTVLRNSGDIGGEYCREQMNKQVTKPFIREFFREVQLPYDTSVVPGDAVRFNTTKEVLLCMNKTPYTLENEVIKYECNFYKCNVSGELKRPNEEEGWDENYRMQGDFALVLSDVYALQTEALFGHELDTDEELGALGLEKHELFISNGSGVQVLDRYEPVSGEYYKVETIKKRRFNQVDVCEITEDTR